MKVKLERGAVQSLKDWINDGDGGINEIVLFVGDGHSGHGLYVSLAEYPEEGAEFLGSLEAA